MDSCLRVPTFLGVHTLALSEELTLDGGALRVWTGAASHHDPTADAATQLLAEQQYRQGVQSSALETRAEQIFFSPPASGNRSLGGPFLRAALRSFDSTCPGNLLHVWLEGGQLAGQEMAGGGAGGEIQWLGPYRLHVISSSICKTGGGMSVAGTAGAGDSLKESETLMVTIAVDKLAAGPAEEPACVALPDEEGEEVLAWLSTQGTRRLCLSAATEVGSPVGGSGGAGGGGGRESGGAEPAEPCSSSSLSSSLPPLLPVAAPRAAEESVELTLHAHATKRLGRDGGFGCEAARWAAEASVMSLGEDEDHLTLALRPAPAGGAPAHRVRAGRYEVCVLQVVGHFLGEAERADDELPQIVSDYPLLLLHAQVSVRRLPSEDDPMADDAPLLSEQAQRQAEARRLGEGLESLLGL